MTASREARAQHDRARVADLAARFMAEHGLGDHALAKRKAARQLGLPGGQGMPSNEEIDAALAERQALFHPEEQGALLAGLRLQAREVMRAFSRFEPALTGAVVTGAACANSPIELEIAEAVSKDFEQFLVNQGIAYKVQDRAARMAYLVYSEPADVLVRMVNPDTRQSPRISLGRLEKLIAETDP